MWMILNHHCWWREKSMLVEALDQDQDLRIILSTKFTSIEITVIKSRTSSFIYCIEKFKCLN